MPIVTLKFKVPEEQEELKHAMDGWKWEWVVEEMFSEIHRWEENSVRKITPDAVRAALVRIRNERFDE